MAKKQDEYVDVYYGIHMDSCEVMSVWVTRDGRMSGTGIGSHQLMPGRSVKSELMIVFGIADAVSIPPHMLDAEFAENIKSDLKEKADEMKKQKAEQAQNSSPSGDE